MKAQILEVGKIIHKDGNIIVDGWSWSFSNILIRYEFEKDTIFGWTVRELEEMSKTPGESHGNS